MITPSALNVLIIGASVIVFTALWRILSIHLADTSVGQAMDVIL